MKGKPVLGLDLGSCTFKLVLLEWRESRPLVTQMRFLELPPGCDEAARQAALKQLLQGIFPAEFAQVVSVVDDPFACLCHVLVPPMPAGELLGAVRSELQQHLAVPPEEAMVDYQPSGEVEVSGVKKQKLLAAALPKAAIQKHLNLLSEAGVRPTQLFLKAVAVARWVQQKSPRKDGPVGLLYLGGSSSEFIVVEGGQPLFTRKVPVSGVDFTKGMTGTLMTEQGQTRLTESEAETIKRSLGIPQDPLSETGAKGISGTQLCALLRGNLERLTAEVERSLVFYGESTGGPAVSELILVGGGAHLKGLSDRLQEHLKIQVQVPDPLEGFQQTPAALQGPASATPLSFVPVLGAALTEGLGINLLPAEIKQAHQMRIQRAALTGVLTATVVGALLIRIGMGVYERTLRTQITAFSLERAAVASELVQARIAFVTQEKQRSQPRWEDLFKELTHVLPREIYLTGLTLSGNEVTLRGQVREQGRPSDQVLADFLRALEEERFFTQVRLISSRQLEGPAKESEFEIRCSLM
ncbi:MAG: pilus assembly protein PilM [Candidatus Omnitrophica bacterium]|nr:pilus assembly protein PilM [Candidatus Omnitrophota bacterium]